MKYILTCLIAMVPIIELRGAIPIAIGWGVDPWVALVMCTVANMLPVPFISFFARKFLLWGQDKPHIGKICQFFLVKGEKAGQKLVAATGRGGLFIALLLFVGIPLPGTGGWTGALVAALMDIRMRRALPAITLGVLIAGFIVGGISFGLFG